MTTQHEDHLHEKLCAYILGEASAEERAEIERELAKSAALRAQKAEIEATIGFVKDAMAGSETLSADATQQVLSAATTRKARPWYTYAPVKIAAGIAALLGGYALYQVAEQKRENPSPTAYELFGDDADVVAQADAPRSQAGAKEKKRLDGAAAELGYVGQRAKDQKSDVLIVDQLAKNEEITFKESTSFGVPSSPTPPVASPSVAAPQEGQLYFQPPQQLGIDAQPGDYEDARLAQSMMERQASQDGNPAAGGTAIGVGAGGHRGTGQPSPFGGRKLGEKLNRRAIGPTAGGPSGPSTPAPGSPRAESAPAGAQLHAESLEALRGLGYLGDEGDNSTQYSGVTSGSDDFFLGRTANRGVENLGYSSGEGFSDRWNSMTALEREHHINRECYRIFERCRPRPNERPRDMFFRFWGDNAFELAALDPQSTFSIDVDTASYALARRYLNEGQLPEKAQIRTEEFLNYFKADVPAPKESTFAIHTDLAPSRFSTDASRVMLRVVIRGREVVKEERKPVALTFVVDTSGSMKEQNRLEMVKHTMRLLVGELDANDSIAIVRFSDDASLVLPMTSAKHRGLIESAIHPLQPQSSTNAEAGLRMGYEAALAGLNPNATNRVVFLSDGVANVGQTDQDRISESVKLAREKGIYLNTVGVGMNNHNDTLLEQLADKGDGMCNYIDTPEEAKRALVDNFTGAFQPIARDVKIQVEFDPAQVYRYRLLGYENRAIADKDFRNDAIDAGEIGAGHQVTALYEIERSNQASEKPLATVRLRWKQPRSAGSASEGDSEKATETERSVLASQATSFEGAGVGYRRSVIVAQFAELLRRSTHARGDSLDELIAEAQKIEREANDADFSELVVLMSKSRALILRDMPRCDELCQAIDVIRRNQILRAEHESLSVERDAKLLEELEKQNADLEAKIRELLRRRLEEKAK